MSPRVRLSVVLALFVFLFDPEATTGSVRGGERSAELREQTAQTILKRKARRDAKMRRRREIMEYWQRQERLYQEYRRQEKRREEERNVDGK